MISPFSLNFEPRAHRRGAQNFNARHVGVQKTIATFRHANFE